MIRQQFQKRMVSSGITLPVTIFICLFVYSMTIVLKQIPEITPIHSIEEVTERTITQPWIKQAINCLLFGITGYLLRELTTAFSLLRIRTTFQTSVYFFLLLCFPYFYQLQVGNIITPLFYIALFFLFRSYQHFNATKLIFYSMFSIGLASLLFPQILYLVPLLYIGIFNFKAFTIKTFFAGLVGILFPYWFLVGYAYYYDQMEIFYQPFLSLLEFQEINYTHISFSEFCSLGLIVGLFLMSSIYYFSFSYQDKIRTRVFLSFLITIGFVLLIFAFLQPQHMSALTQLSLPIVAIVAGRMFALSSTKFSNFLFILCLVLTVGIIGFNIWML